MLSRLRYLLILPLVIAVLLGVGCDGEHRRVREEVLQRLAPYQQKLSFNLAIPSYLPEGTEREGITYLDEGASFRTGDTGIVFTFNEGVDTTVPLDKRPRIEIQERPAELDQTPAGFSPIPTAEGVEETSLGGRNVVIDRQHESQDIVFIHLSSYSAGVLIEVKLDWINDGQSSRIELTDEMEREALRVFQSMF